MTAINASSTSGSGKGAEAVLASHRIGDTSLYTVGMFDAGVTVLSQQQRALNLAWALVEGEIVPCRAELPGNDGLEEQALQRKKVAIIGAGFSGLTLAAGLLAKQAWVEVSIFERRDTLLPLQNGSDTRWLHPHIYDWPSPDCHASAAMLPLLNWTAGRASDVAVQVLTEWKVLVDNHGRRPEMPTADASTIMHLFCNARHLQIGRGVQGKLSVEWVGEERNVADGTLKVEPEHATKGDSDEFDLIVLAIGFGLETGNQLSYWRNDFIAQPSLSESSQTYVISGQGDGAMVDLLRATITQFRQDRILYEVFEEETMLRDELRELAKKAENGGNPDIYAQMKQIFAAHGTVAEERLRNRLRRDTHVVLRLKVKTISELFQEGQSRISFQNKVLVYLLYRCGAFTPSSDDDSAICSAYGTNIEGFVRRHGTNKREQLRDVLSENLRAIVEPYLASSEVAREKLQDDTPLWAGGYFGFPGPASKVDSLPDHLKGTWQKEYLPSATSLVATSFCAGVAGALAAYHDPDKRLRVTLHRILEFGRDERLQQCCAYHGLQIDKDASTAGRTFGIGDGTIGLCVSTRTALRTLPPTDHDALDRAMTTLNLNRSSRLMSKHVRSICAIPFLEPAGSYYGRSPISMVLYVDSDVPDFFSADIVMAVLSRMCRSFLTTCQDLETEKPDRIVNVPGSEVRSAKIPAMTLEEAGLDAASILEVIPSFDLPVSAKPFQLNFDYSDFRIATS